ncbi:VPA1269 family protein [Roseomonas genomospecies 6]|uniref:Tyr recombinase domain-containing protein n=1 Tax=Roseomonas genomospecies 6 TaxID=214106 RepID=A0A9W7NJ91_9PROT|nr:VPA1269 family protein [Roseomonas genomospecies 6]KAA0680336.1 hypothetical protein DS843_13565 [Roseomonas genomospecies 6]
MLRPNSEFCKEYQYPGSDRVVLANMSKDQFLLFREPKDKDMARVWGMYESEYLKHLHWYLTATYSEVTWSKSRQPERVVGTNAYNGICELLKTEVLPLELVAEVGRLHLMNAGEQRAWVLQVIGKTWSDLRHVAKKPLRKWLPPTKDEFLNGGGWIDGLERMVAEHTSTFANKTSAAVIPPQVTFLLCLLHREGFLLFPSENWGRSVNYVPNEAWLAASRRVIYDSTVAALEDLTTGYGRANNLPRLPAVLRSMLLTTIKEMDDVHRDFNKDFYDYRSDNKAVGETVIRSLTLKILRHWSEQVHGAAKLEDEGLEGRDLFQWTRYPKKNNLPTGVENYHPDATIIGWGDALQSVMGALNHMYMDDHRRAANSWLAYLWSLDERPRDLTDVVRDRHINSGEPKGGCFRSYVLSMDIRDDRKLTIVRLLGKLFDLLISQRNLAIKNPIVYDLDKFRSGDSRRKTVRMPLSIDLMSYIREFNCRGEFAFSRSLDVHYCERRDPATDKVRKMWWPGVAVAIHFLLELPLRGFQVRFLDSGEADEETVDVERLRWLRNTSEHARNGRSKGVLYIEQGWEGDPFLGVYVNTNKTGVSDARSGYRIPWCPPELADYIRMLAEWNRANNNVGECPLLEKKNYNEIKNPVVKAAVGTCFPLFRDPITDDGYPLQRRRLDAYWHRLVRAVEDEINASPERKDKRPLHLTRLDGNGEEAERVSLFDIHSLRVSGITNLIERGLPPSMVMEIVGHATVVMTLYYNRTRMENLNARLRDVLGRYPSPASIPDLDIPQIEDLLEHLVNIRPSAQGKDLVRDNPQGFGNGSFHIFVDGICPGGECDTGGEGTKGGAVPVPRPRACSLCRYRLTGPSFLGGLVYNANRLMYELRKIGERITGLLEDSTAAEERGEGTGIYEAQINGLYEEASNVSIEWAAEVQYIHHVLDMMDANAEGDGGQLVLIGADAGEVSVARQAKTDFHLLQELVRSADIMPGFKPDKGIVLDHRELLNDILSQNDLDPFLVRLDPKTRDRAAVMLGEVFLKSIPEGEFSGLLDGGRRLVDFSQDLPATIAAFGERMVNGALPSSDEAIVIDSDHRDTET